MLKMVKRKEKHKRKKRKKKPFQQQLHLGIQRHHVPIRSKVILNQQHLEQHYFLMILLSKNTLILMVRIGKWQWKNLKLLHSQVTLVNHVWMISKMAKQEYGHGISMDSIQFKTKLKYANLLKNATPTYSPYKNLKHILMQ